MNGSPSQACVFRCQALRGDRRTENEHQDQGEASRCAAKYLLKNRHSHERMLVGSGPGGLGFGLNPLAGLVLSPTVGALADRAMVTNCAATRRCHLRFAESLRTVGRQILTRI